MAQIAADTGGRYVHITTADHLIDQLDRSQRKKTVYVEQPLYWPPRLLGAVRRRADRGMDSCGEGIN